MKRYSFIQSSILLGVASIGLSACNADLMSAIANNQNSTDQNGKKQKLVCDPFRPQSLTTQPQIHGRLYGDIENAHYSTHNVLPHFFVLNSLGFERHLMSDVLLRLSSINVLPKFFDTGFPVSGSGSNPEVLRSEIDGSPILEYFAMRLESQIKLSSSDEEGFYEFAYISDDGVRMRFAEDSQDWISEDWTHPPLMTCAAQLKYFGRNDKKRVTMEYFQGPRYEIAHALMWRKQNATRDLYPPEYFCERQNEQGPVLRVVPHMGENLDPYFTNNGWKILSPDNYELPSEISYSAAEQCE